jgi:cellulose synthase/poly-beta-1,6-N-acetylglucosamine synthase-like glycosyltransferase
MEAILFWLSLGSLMYVYAGFPLLVAVIGGLRRRYVRKQPVTPSVSIIIAAYNEEKIIAQRLENVLALDYPRGKLEIIVASDGSDDATPAIADAYAERGVLLLTLPRRGKINALNAAVAQARGEILLFSDANSIFSPNALRKLAANFADPEVGGVAGNTGYRLQPDTESSGQGEKLYWKYDTWLKEMESLAGNIVSAHGGMYAIRRELYQPIEDAAVTDDFTISTGVVEQGYRLVFESEAHAWELAVRHAGGEFWRKVRIITRGLRALILRKSLLNPFRYGFYSVVLFSHKLLRRLLPFSLPVLLVSSIVLAPTGRFYFWIAAGQGFFYTLAGAGYLLRRTSLGRSKCFYIPFFYCLANAAALVGVLKLVTRQRIEVWRPQRHGVGA